MNLIRTFIFISLCLIHFSTQFTFANTEEQPKILEPAPPAFMDQLIVDLESKSSSMLDKALEKQKVLTESVHDFIKRVKFSASGSYALDFLEFFDFRMRYKNSVEPAHVGGYYSRLDSYTARLQFSPLSWFLENNLPVVVSMTPETSIEFHQLFPSQLKALNPIHAKFITSIPYTAERAISELRPGDLVHMNSFLNLYLGVRGEWLLGTAVEIESQVGFLVRGQFNIFVFRAEENKVRLRLIKRKLKAGVFDNKIGLKDDIGLFGVKIVNNKIIEWLQLDEVLRNRISYGLQNVILADFTLDLSYPEVRTAYNHLISSNLVFKDTYLPSTKTLISPHHERTELSKVFISDLTEMNELYRQDLANPNPETRRVHRNFLGNNLATGDFDINNRGNLTRFVGFKHTANSQKNHLTRYILSSDGVEASDYFTLPTWNERSSRDIDLFGYHEEEFKSSDIVFKADDQFNISDFLSMGFYYEYRDSHYKIKEHSKGLLRLKLILPPFINNQLIEFLNSQPDLNFNDGITNARISARYFINSQGFRVLESIYGRSTIEETTETIRRLLIDHWNASSPPTKKVKLKFRGCTKRYKNESRIVKHYCREIDFIAGKLAVISNPSISFSERSQVAMDLMSHSLFKKIGAGFIFKLLPADEKLADLCRFEFRVFHPKSIEPLTYIYGSTSERELYETLLDLQRLMKDLSPDMRLDGDVDDLTHRKVIDR